MRRRRPHVHVSILWRTFTVNALVFGTAVTVLALSPATIHYHIRPSELAVLLAGLLVTLLVDLALLAFVLSPMRALARLMGTIDPLSPGQRANVGRWASSEAGLLANAFNNMLDRLEDERRESARSALAAREAERLRIARELHDELGQALTAVAIQAERAAAGSEDARATLAEISRVIQASLDDVRRIARELRPEALEDLGLVDALISLCTRVERQSGTRVRRDFQGGLPALGAEAEIVLYRVAQEALTNAMRHARASEVRVALTAVPGGGSGVRLVVADDGRGLGDAAPGQGGLAGMRERAMLIGAELELEPSPGGGVTVALTVGAAGVAAGAPA